MATFQVQLWVGDLGGEGDTPFVLLAEVDLRRLLVEPNTKAFQLMLDELLVRDGLEAVQHDEDQITRPRSADDLRTRVLPAQSHDQPQLDPDTEHLVVTCLPRPLPSLAPSMMPGRSSSWTLAPLYRTTPGTQVRVVNS